MFASVGWPVVDRVFGVSPHGVFIAIGFLIGSIPFTRLAVRRGITPQAASSVVFWSLVGAIVGARVGYVIAHSGDFESPLEWLYIWQGGISLLGGIAGATIANAVNIRRYQLRFFQVADCVAPALAIGIAIGRIGDLIIGDHLGKPTSWLLAWVYKGGALAPPFFPCVGSDADFCANLQDGLTQEISREGARLLDGTEVLQTGIGVHQTAMYDMLIAWALFAFLWWFIKLPRREGVATLIFGLVYGVARLIEDSLRIDKRFGPLTGSQWTALTVATLCAAVLIWFAAKKPPGPTTPARTAEPLEPPGSDDTADLAPDEA